MQILEVTCGAFSKKDNIGGILLVANIGGMLWFLRLDSKYWRYSLGPRAIMQILEVLFCFLFFVAYTGGILWSLEIEG